MKKIILFFLFVFFISSYLYIFKKNHCSNKQSKTYLIENKKHCLLTASSQKQWESGLMFYKKPVNFDGMIFVFPNKQTRTFWNRNTYLDLDIYWMDGDTVVGKSILPSILKSKQIVVIKSEKEVDRVVEIIK